MFDCFYTIRHNRMDFTVKSVRFEYMVWCIWLAMQVHMAMDKFVKDGMKYNSTISAAFVWFFTKQSGSNVKLDSDLNGAVELCRKYCQGSDQGGQGGFQARCYGWHQCQRCQVGSGSVVCEEFYIEEVTWGMVDGSCLLLQPVDWT
jgi:hypothetical protein